MAQLNFGAAGLVGSLARAQWAAVARLRWQIFRNGLFRKGQRSELAARLILYPLLAGLFAVPVLGAGIAGFFLATSGHLDRLSWLLWGLFLLAQFTGINFGQPGTSFDPNQLIRFPLPLRQFVLLRLFFGLLSPANILVALCGGATAIGLSLALPRLWLPIVLALLVFVVVNVLFSRMLFAWVDRWLSTRRAREIFTAFLFIGSLGFQYANVTFNSDAPRHHRQAGNLQRWHRLGHLYEQARPVVRFLPPELTAYSVERAKDADTLRFAAATCACGLYGLLFLAVFTWRMRTEFHGESLSDEAHGGAATAPPRAAASSKGMGQPSADASGRAGLRLQWLPDPVLAVLSKEVLYTRRNIGILYSLIAPLAMVFLFAGRLATRNSTPWVFPAALAYTLIGVVPLSFNSFGLEGTGSQFYFFAPVRLRDILLAKNMMSFGLAVVEVAATVIVITVATRAPSFFQLSAGLLWTAGTLLISTSVGNRRSLSAPRQIKLAKLSGKQASPLSALLSLGILLTASILGVVVLIAARRFHLPWLPLLIFAVFFGAGLTVYLASLRRLDVYARSHREELFAELCKT